MEASLESRVYNHEQGGRPVGLSLPFSLGEPLLGPWFPCLYSESAGQGFLASEHLLSSALRLKMPNPEGS